MATVTAARNADAPARQGQTIEGFVGTALDDAKISPRFIIKVIALIAAGYFFDVIDVIVLGSLVPDMLQTKFATGAEAALIGSATMFGMFVGTAGQGEFSDRFGRKTIYQFNLLLFGVFTILGAFAPSVTWLLVCALHRRRRHRRRAAAGFRLCRRIFTEAHSRPHAGDRAFHRRRLRVADRTSRVHAAPSATNYVWRGVWIVIGIGALIVWVFRFSLPESPRLSVDPRPRQGSARHSRQAGHCRDRPSR